MKTCHWCKKKPARKNDPFCSDRCHGEFWLDDVRQEARKSGGHLQVEKSLRFASGGLQ
jgi:hypothetical protein